MLTLFLSETVEAVPEQKYECVLSGQGYCSDTICLGNKVRLGPHTPITLKLNFRTGDADLNGIHGRIFPGSPVGSSSRIYWDDLEVLGSPLLLVQRSGSRTLAILASGGHNATFACK